MSLALSSPTPSSSSSPSSSAVTIPTPGKSILKRAPAQQQSLFSRFTRFLPTQNIPGVSNNNNNGGDTPLKRAHFILPSIATVYPISSYNPPSLPGLKEEKRAIETREMERRRRVVRGDSVSSATGGPTEEWWDMDKVDGFYKECCTGCDEMSDPGVTLAFKRAANTKPRTVDMSGIQLNLTSAAILSDVFSIEWGLRKLVFKECDLDEVILKPMLHALLIPNSLTFLSVASNRRLKVPAFRLLGAYLEKSDSLQFLDLSQNPLDKKSIEYIVAALKTPPETGLATLRLDDCALKPGALEALSRAVRTSALRNISLRYNRINNTGAVALALMIRDYPDVVPASPSATPLPMTASLSLNSASSSRSNSPASSTVPLPQTSAPPPAGPVLPPPRHPTTTMQTTYTPYVPRSKRGQVSTPQINPLSASGQPIPIMATSSQGGITARQVPPSIAPHAHSGPSAALLDKVRALDSLPRVGALRTLDLKGNDLRNGISFLAQVLKRNRTLKVLNLSENKLDPAGLVAIAEALKYNSSLETLDLSRNPCASGLEGIQSLRTAFTLNTALKRLFLSATSLTSTGAIALAEFLPESSSLLHLDLTQNQLDLASVIALEQCMKANQTMRCLDLDVPPGDEEFARCCRGILNSCVRNTEEAQKNADVNGGKKVWGILDESELAKRIRMETMAGSDLSSTARVCITQLQNLLHPPSAELSVFSNSGDAAKRGKEVVEELGVLIAATDDPSKIEELFGLHDELSGLVGKVEGMGAQPRQKPVLSLQGLGIKFNGSPRASPRPSPLILEDAELSTPRIDKGKAKADPVHEPILSPTSALLGGGIEREPLEDDERGRFPSVGHDGSDEETEEDREVEERSKSWVTEEGEVFRKGTVLLGPEEMEGEYAGEELKRELLDAMVERPPPRPLSADEFGNPLPDMDSPPLNGSSSPKPDSPHVKPPEPAKPPPRPYIPRRGSNSSIMSLVSPTTGSPTVPQTVKEAEAEAELLTLGPSLSRMESPRQG
ncbi:RNI-like protein [Cylindrobasidium torrendii FP15055 ss-10]|uniref:RNI-like protein n=1 Tax=Cylindrobasidium torrendii FP15055 ss-10 TaxID=1314674 RepID=A0A0D7B924_9AGAR|nr:RNI-like protein [Cylindrobasidium torrendii FP15055 ss-10]